MSTLNAGTVTGYLELQDRLSPAVVLASQKVTGFANVLDNLGTNVTSIGRDMLPLTAALGAAGAASSVLAGTFEASMTRLVSIAGVSQHELQGVKRDVLALALDTGVGPQMLAEGMTKISSTVSDTATAMDILKIAALGTKAGFGETVAVGGALTAVINSYGAANLSAAQAGNIMAVAIKEGGAEAKELAPTLANVVPFAAQMGVSFQEVSANIATLTKLGVPTAEAVTQLTSVMTAATKETKQGAEALKSVGMSYEMLRDNIKNKGLAAALTELQEKFRGNTTGLADVFGRIEALRNVMGTAGVQADTYAKVLDKINKAAKEGKALQEMADAMNGTTVQTWAELSALVQVIAIKFGDALAPALKQVLKAAMPVLEWVIKAVDWFTKLPQPVQTAGIALGSLVAVGPVALMGIGTGISAVSGAFKGISAAITGPAIMMSWLDKLAESTGLAATAAAKSAKTIRQGQELVGAGWAIMGGPIVAIVAGIVAIGYAWGQFKGDWTRGFDIIIPGLGMFRDGIDRWSEALDRAKSAFKALMHGEGWDRFMAILNGFGKATLPNVTAAIRDLPAPLKALTNGLEAASGASVVLGDGLDSAKVVAGGFREELAEVKAEVAALTSSERDAIRAGLEMGKGVADISARLKVSEAAVHMYKETLDDGKEATKKLTEASKELQKAIGENMKIAAEQTAASWKAQAAAMDEAGEKAMKVVEENFKARKSAEEELSAMLKKANMSQANFAISEIERKLAEDLKALDMTKDGAAETAAALKALAAGKIDEIITDDALAQMIIFGNETTRAAEKVKEMNKAAKAAAYDGLADFFTSLGQIAGEGGLGTFMKAAGNVVVGFKSAQQEALKLGKNGKELGGDFGMLSTVFNSNASGAARFAAGVASAAVITQGAIAIWDEAGKATTRLGGAFNGAMAGASAGAAFGPWGAAAGAAVGVVVSLFQDKVKKAVQEANVEIDKLRDGLIKTYGPMEQLEATAQRVGMTFKNEWGHQGPEGLAKMREMAEQLEQRVKAVDAAAQKVIKYFSSAVKVLASPYLELKKAFDEAEAASKKAGDALAEASADADSTRDKIEDLSKAWNDAEENFANAGQALQDAAATAKPILDDLGTTAVAAFAAAYAATGDYNAALLEVQAPLAELAEAYAALGLDVENVALNHLMIQSTVAEGNPDLMAAISGQAGGMQALAQLGLLNVDTFGAMERTGFQMYTILQGKVAEAGGETRDALMPMQGYLQQAAKQAELLGIPLDANTQMLIDQSKELGLWKDTGASALDKVIAGMDTLVGKVTELLNTMLGVSGAITGLPARRDVEVNVHENVYRRTYESEGDEADRAARGGLVTAGGVQYFSGGGTVFEPSGTDTVPAMLTPGERVLSIADAEDYDRNESRRSGFSTAGMETALAGIRSDLRRNNDTLLINLKSMLAQAGV